VVMALRQLLAVVALPVTVTIVVPFWLRRRYGLVAQLPEGALEWAAIAAGMVALGIGLTLFAASLARFIVQGKGTLAPWDPPRRLVVVGVYRHVRNPMYVATAAVIVGEGLLLRRPILLLAAAVYLTAMAVLHQRYEAPLLARRFGPAYDAYRDAVPGWLPRLTPYRNSDRQAC